MFLLWQRRTELCIFSFWWIYKYTMFMFCLVKRCPLSLRVTPVHAGRHAEPPGQQCGADQKHGHGGGRVSELPYGLRWNQTQI